MNSLDVATKVALRDTVVQAAEDDAVRCVVLTGTGRAFCVGQDLKEHIELLEDGTSDALFRTVPDHYNPIGHRAGDDAQAGDRGGQRRRGGRRREPRVRLRLPARRRHGRLQPRVHRVALSCDTGSSWTLPRLVGRAKALELLYFPRTISADEALELGLATKVVPAADLAGEVADLAARLAAGPTVAFGAVRRSVATAPATTSSRRWRSRPR